MGQLRLALCEHRAALRGHGSTLPVGLSRMKLEELRVEATQRSIPLQAPEGRSKTREMLIRDIREHEEHVTAKTITSVATTRRSTSPRERSASGTRGHSEDVEWMLVDHPAETESSEFLSGSSAGSAAMTRAQELLGRMPQEDLRKLLTGLVEGKRT